VKLIII
jgi:hypothetical protein